MPKGLFSEGGVAEEIYQQDYYKNLPELTINDDKKASVCRQTRGLLTASTESGGITPPHRLLHRIPRGGLTIPKQLKPRYKLYIREFFGPLLKLSQLLHDSSIKTFLRLALQNFEFHCVEHAHWKVKSSMYT